MNNTNIKPVRRTSLSPSTSTGNSGLSSKTSGSGRVPVIPRMDKPQGFEDGKLAKRGIHRCFWNGDHYFDSQDEAKHHPDCPERQKVYKDIIAAKLLRGEEITQLDIDESEGRFTWPEWKSNTDSSPINIRDLKLGHSSTQGKKYLMDKFLLDNEAYILLPEEERF